MERIIKNLVLTILSLILFSFMFSGLSLLNKAIWLAIVIILLIASFSYRKKLFYALLFILPFSTLLYLDSPFSLGFPFYIIDILILVILISWVFSIKEISFSRLDYAVIIFFIICTGSVLLTIITKNIFYSDMSWNVISIFKSYVDSSKLFSITMLWRLFEVVMLYFYIKNDMGWDERKKIVTTIIYSICAVILFSLWQIANPGTYHYMSGDSLGIAENSSHYISGTFPNPNIFGGYLALVSIFPLLAFIDEKGWKMKAFYLSLFIMILALLFLASARASMLGVLIGACFFIAFTSKRMKTIVPIAIIGLIFVAGIAVSTGLLTKEGVKTDSSLSYRTGTIWPNSWSLFLDKPLFGHGLGQFSYAYKENIAGKGTEHAHSLYLEILVELGIIGLLSFAYMMYAFFMRKTDRSMLCLFSVVIAFLVSCIFDYLLYWHELMLMFFIVLALSEVREGKHKGIDYSY